MGLAVRRGLKLDNCLVRGTEIDTPGAQSHLQSGVVTVLDQEVIRLVHLTAGTIHEFVSLCGYLTIDDLGHPPPLGAARNASSRSSLLENDFQQPKLLISADLVGLETRMDDLPCEFRIVKSDRGVTG